MTVSVFAAVAAAAAFHPARKRIQEFVDKSFYRLSYDYRKTILEFNEKAQRMISRDHLLNFFLIKLQKVLPLEHIGVCLHAQAENGPSLFMKRGQEIDIDSIRPILPKEHRILAQKGALKTEENIDFSQEMLLKEKRLQMILPLIFRHRNLSGFLTLGRKMSGERFSRDDLELLKTMAGVLVLNLERISLQEEVIREKAEKEKLDELNRLKTEFISTVSHELRTPMSSIQGITELLKEGKIKDEARRAELVSLVASESSRLSQLLHNILDFGKIEQQAKTYQFQKKDICCFLQDTMRFLQPRLEKEDFTSRVFLPEKPLHLMIDEDAVKEALINLVDNAIKYSEDKREIEIKVIEMDDCIEIQVRDKGIGIPLEEQQRIFEKFYRHPEAVRLRPKGVGLGLKIVKHVIESHKGKIKVVSQPRKGSTFSLIFPKP
ncbi:MAG: sensor histidine kinase [Candidatus Aminicenantales bacterium]